jgi:ATP-dependent RNA helicase DBP3
MSKRSRDEAATVDESKEARREAKRLKKEKKAKKAEAAEAKVEDAVVNGTADAVEEKKEGEKKELSKEERKALKRAEKEKEKAEAEAEAEGKKEDEDKTAGVSGDKEAAAKAERKALKQAEKAAKKAAKAAKASAAAEEEQAEAGAANGAATEVKNREGTVGYQEDAALSALPQSEIDAFIAEKKLAIEDPKGQSYRPITNFKYLPIDEALRPFFANFKEPTPIQAAVWPYLLAGRDMIGVAETGSGKTLAFGVPCVRSIANLSKKDRKHIKACIVSPTRELALQIHEQLVKLAEPAGLKVTCIYGGQSKDEQRTKAKGTHIIVATPGRLNDFLQEGSIDLSHTTYVVLDEADRMLDKGFEEPVRQIISATSPQGRQTLMFTATWPPSVRELADTFMTNPVRVTIGDNASGELRANTRIVQEVEVMDPKDKQNRLIQLLKQYQSGGHKNDRILVFCLYKKEATRIEEFIRRRNFNVAGIHGDLSQTARTASLESFKAGRVPLLVATDVAARGLDIPSVKLVINYTFPLTAEDYVHRIGRTGRAGKEGKAITFFTEEEKGLAGALINVLKAADQNVPEDLMKFGTTVKKKEHEAYGRWFKDTGDQPMKKATKITFD